MASKPHPWDKSRRLVNRTVAWAGYALAVFSDFIRLRICVFCTSVAVIGYLLNKPANSSLLGACVAAFMCCAATYAYNNTKDLAEDEVNRGRTNRLARVRTCWLLPAALYGTGFFIVLSLPSVSVATYLLSTSLGVVYSACRLKNSLLLKNVYTGFGIPLVYFIGAAAVSPEIIADYVMLSLFLFCGSVISDLRDFEGDKVSNVRTLPTFLGYEAANGISKMAVASVLLLVLAFRVGTLMMLSPFLAVMLYLLVKDRPELAHTAGGISLIVLAGYLSLS
jgi:4-hydroxybenzoate polyprenyltransferase